ncbi:hypothetical protein [Stenotrophomonas nematodicola]|uniref:Lipoprotein n=1 Tax=Stenotrophomonas nematodicola TaxID=2656746 RepID=A0ABW7D1M8_9GAMM
MSKLVLLALLSALVGCAGSGPKVWRVVSKQGSLHFVEIDERFAADADVIGRVGEEVCKGKRSCVAAIWSSKDRTPSALPVSFDVLATQLASYQQNTTTGLHKLMLDCERVAAQDKSNCLPDAPDFREDIRPGLRPGD